MIVTTTPMFKGVLISRSGELWILRYIIILVNKLRTFIRLELEGMKKPKLVEIDLDKIFTNPKTDKCYLR
ncbi:hypothetical protein BTH160X_220027 [Brochothrix thermosphacta]|nr:hypothetical protein BTH160X_220027 [Brochothrix thermosphacta]